MSLREDRAGGQTATASLIAAGGVPQSAETELKRLRRLLAARQAWKFWSSDFWSARRTRDLPKRIAELEACLAVDHFPVRDQRVLTAPPMKQSGESAKSEIWRREQGRIVCRLQPAPPGGHKDLAHESVADRPEIELHFSTASDPPMLVEVQFAPTMSIEDAKTYLHREWKELPLPAGATRWDVDPARCLLRFHDDSSSLAIELEPGVHEHFRDVGETWQTVALEFDASAGWTRDRAADWVRHNVRVAGAGRSA
jgi:hypothetical protein